MYTTSPPPGLPDALPGMLPPVLDLLLDAVFIVNEDGRILYVNAACERLLGYAPAEMIGRVIFTFLWHDEHERTSEEVQRVMGGLLSVGFENRYRHKDGYPVTLMWSARWSPQDRVRIGVARDVTHKRKAEAVQAATYAISEAAHHAEDLEALLREVHRIVATLVPVTGFAAAIRNPDSGALHFAYQEGTNVSRMANSDTQALALAHAALASGQPQLHTTSAHSCWLALPLEMHHQALGALLVTGRPGAVYASAEQELLQFVSTQVAAAIERKQLHAQLLQMAQHDELTGLPNRYLFRDRVETALARAQREQKRAALLYIDLDGFKQVNDVLGHAAGDTLLREIALRLRQVVREVDTVARLGGDEFVVILEQIRQTEDAHAVRDKLAAAVVQPLSIEGRDLCMRPSIGLAFYPEDGTSADQLLRQADSRMYALKRQSR